MELDKFDRGILALLQEDATVSIAEIAERVGLSSSPCWRRVQRMHKEGVIRGRVALLEREKLGLAVMIFAEVKLAVHGRKSLSEFENAVRRFPEVLECHTVLGEVDYLLRVVTEDIHAYERFFRQRLSQVPGVAEINSRIVISEIKSTTALPLPGA